MEPTEDGDERNEVEWWTSFATKLICHRRVVPTPDASPASFIHFLGQGLKAQASEHGLPNQLKR